MAVAHVLRAHGASDGASSDSSSPLGEGGSTAGGEGESASPGERAHRERERPFQRERADKSSSDTQSIIARPRTRSRDGAEASSEINTSTCADQDTSRVLHPPSSLCPPYAMSGTEIGSSSLLLLA
eukprot:2059379-Rhodomonas_salina.3